MAEIITTRAPRTRARAEPVGSLLRDPRITAQIDQMYAGQASPLRAPVVHKHPEIVAELNRLADEQVRRVVQRQIDAGLDVITDGEVRRATFLGSLYDAVEGLVPADERIIQQDEEGNVLHEWMADPEVVSRLQKRLSPIAEEATFMRAVTDHPFKVTLPAPSYYLVDFVPLRGSSYSSKLEFVEDVVAIEKQLAAEAVAAGARYIQFDFPIYPALVDTQHQPGMRSGIENLGESPEWAFDRALELDRAVTEGLPDDVTTALHLCRGSVEGGIWSGSLAPIAERIFNELPHQRFLFEWEDIAREGDYAPIKHVPKDRTMAMGLVSAKTPALEDEDEILRRIDAASEHLPIEQLALCPQCGFASLYGDHLIQAEDAQWRKLELIGRVADRVWGS